ncbi:MAG: DUF4058 family protein [Caldilineaceae bacterium]
MPTPFPGMDPYLERPGLWKQVHTGLIIDIQKYLAQLLRPKYQVAVEQRTFVSLAGANKLVGEPDVLIVGTPAQQPNGRTVMTPAPAAVALAEAPAAYVVDLPMPEEITERWLEVRDVVTGEAITVIEILSPSNKLEDRQRYEKKRLKILGSMTHLIEIDLLRVGKAMTMHGEIPTSHYRILVSRAPDRPQAEVLLFSVRTPIPAIIVPLLPGDDEPALPLNRILHNLYDQAGYDLFINYAEPPLPPFPGEDVQWVADIARQANHPMTE